MFIILLFMQAAVAKSFSSGWTQSQDLNQYWSCKDPSIPPQSFLSLHCLFSVFLDTVFHFFELLLLCVFSDQGLVNVGLFNHPYVFILLPFTCPSTQKDFHPSCLTSHMWKHLKHTPCFCIWVSDGLFSTSKDALQTILRGKSWRNDAFLNSAQRISLISWCWLYFFVITQG